LKSKKYPVSNPPRNAGPFRFWLNARSNQKKLGVAKILRAWPYAHKRDQWHPYQQTDKSDQSTMNFKGEHLVVLVGWGNEEGIPKAGGKQMRYKRSLD